MATISSNRGSDLSSTTAEARQPKRIAPVKLWAVLGAVFLAFQVFTVMRWVSGPYFERVPQGPSEPPTWMKIELIAWQALSIPVALTLLYMFVIRPWRRDGRVGVDGLIAIAAISVAWHDPISAYAQPWFTYNSYMLNYGSWVAGIPGMPAFHAPGAMVQEPILFIYSAYVYIFVGASALGAWIMRTTRKKFPATSAPSLIAVCFGMMILFDIVLEGVIFLPLGVFEYPGGHVPLLFGDTYHKYPLQEMLTIVPVFTAAGCLKFFVGDRGSSFVEKGIEKFRGGPGRTFLLRLLAVTAFLNVAMAGFYTIPNTILSLNQPEWPRDLQERSYLTDYVCGDGTDRACPGPNTPIIRQGAPYLGTDGKLVVPPGAEPPQIYKFQHTD